MATANVSLNQSALSVAEVNNAISLINPVIINIITAVIIFLIGVVIGKIIEKLLLKILELINLDKYLKKRFGFKFSLSKIFSRAIAYLAYIIALVMALNRLSITTAVITTIVILLIIVLVLFIIFGANDLFANFFAGLVIKLRGNITVGDYVRLKDKKVEGYIITMNFLNIRLETGKDESVFIPNMVIYRSGIIKVKKR